MKIPFKILIPLLALLATAFISFNAYACPWWGGNSLAIVPGQVLTQTYGLEPFAGTITQVWTTGNYGYLDVKTPNGMMLRLFVRNGSLIQSLKLGVGTEICGTAFRSLYRLTAITLHVGDDYYDAWMPNMGTSGAWVF